MELSLTVRAVKGKFRADDVKEENLLQFVSDSVNFIVFARVPFSYELIKSEVNFIIHNDVPVSDQATGKNVHVINDSRVGSADLFFEGH